MLPPVAAWIAAASLLAVLALAPPASNLAWGVNGLRSVAPGTALAVLVAAVALAWLVLRTHVPGAALAAAGALVLAFPLREKLHLLGDTLLRLRQVENVIAFPDPAATFGAINQHLHAQPLDGLLCVQGVLALARAGVPPSTAFPLVSCALALATFAALGRLARRVAPGEPALAAAAALALAGTLEALAGYGESAGLVLAAGAWWWATLLAPLPHRRAAARATLAWLVLFLSHRIALLALVPHLARLALPPLEGDTREGRRALALFTVLAAAVAATWLWASGGGALGRDAANFLGVLPRAAKAGLVPASDLLNLVVLTMPLVVLAPWFAGRAALGGLLRSPLGRLHVVALLPLLPLLLLFPVAPDGLGAHRDWDLATLPGLLGTSLAVAAIGRLDEPRRRGAWTVLLPVLAVLAGAWLVVNADEAASRRRAEALANGPHALAGDQRAHVLEFLGYTAADHDQDAEAARRFEQSYEVLHNARNALTASESWLRAGDTAAARRMLALARSRGPLPPGIERGAKVIEGMIAQAEARQAGLPAPAGSANRATARP